MEMGDTHNHHVRLIDGGERRIVRRPPSSSLGLALNQLANQGAVVQQVNKCLNTLFEHCSVEDAVGLDVQPARHRLGVLTGRYVGNFEPYRVNFHRLIPFRDLVGDTTRVLGRTFTKKVLGSVRVLIDLVKLFRNSINSERDCVTNQGRLPYCFTLVLESQETPRHALDGQST